MACSASGSNGNSQIQLLLRTMSRSIVLLQLWPVLKSEASIATEGYMEAWGQTTTSDLVGVQGPYYHYSHFDLNGLCFHPEPGCHPGPKLLPRAMSGSMVLLQQGSMLMSAAHVTSGAKGTTCDKIRGPC